MDRRSFLLGTGTLALSQMLASCSNQEQVTLRVGLLKGSIPAQVVREFRNAIEKPTKLDFASTGQLQNLFNQLQAGQNPKIKTADDWRSRLPIPGIRSQPAQVADLVTLGDYWLAPAIEQNLIQPFDPAQWQQWSNLPTRWQELVQRNEQGRLDTQGKVWAAPYRWGSMVIAFNREQFKSLNWTPSDWGDLWREELRERISLLNHPRAVIGLTLKKLGRSYNTENLNSVTNLEQQLADLDRQVKFYSSKAYLQPLILGDTWLAVGWSTDVLPVMQRYQQIDAVIPQSGTALWADLWVRPMSERSSTSTYQQWIDFCWRPQIARQISLLTKANSPIPVQIKPTDIKAGFRHLLLPEPRLFQQSEFLLPLAQATMQQYQSLWQAMHQVRVVA